MTQISITYSEAVSAVHDQLAVVGKRLRDKEGSLLWANTTFSSAESAVIRTHVRQAVSNVVSSILNKVQGYQANTTSVFFRVSKNRVMDESTYGTILKDMIMDYITTYCVAMWDQLTRADQSGMFRQESERRLLAIRDFVYNKTEPEVSENEYSQVTGRVE